MLYACVNPFVARRNRPSAEDLTHALILPDDQDIALSKFPGIVTAEKTDFGKPVHKELRVKMGVVDELLTDGTNRYWNPPRDAKGQPFSLYPYQLAGVTFTLAKKGRALIMDPMGLGKTLQGIGVLAAGGFLPEEALPGDTPYLPAVVVCPANAVPAWVSDLGTWTPAIRVKTAANAEEARKNLLALAGTPGVLVLTKEQLVAVADHYGDDISVLFRNRVRTVIVDESHYVKNAETKLAQALMQIAPVVDHLIMLTGTPILNASGELYSQLQILEATKQRRPFFADQDDFLHHMAGSRVPTREQSDFRDYVDYDPQTVQGVNRYLRKRGVRRSRADAVKSGINLYPAVPDQMQMQKNRSLRIVPHEPDALRDLATAYNTYLQALSRRRTQRSDGQSDFVDRGQAFSRFKQNLDLQILTASQGDELSPEAVDQIVQNNIGEVKRILLRGHFPVNEAMKQVIASTILPHVADYVSNRKRPVVVFTDRKGTRDRLKNLLLNDMRRGKIPPTRIYTTDGSKKVYLTAPDGESHLLNERTKRGKLKEGLYPLTHRFRFPKKVTQADRNAVIILTKSGLEGLNLASASEVVFAGRFDNPGQEYQAEDRINRPDQVTPPKATYFLGLDPFSLSLSNRQEKKRNSILSALGESPTSDFSFPLDTSRARVLALQALPDFQRAFGTELIEPFFAELDPRGYIRDQIDEYHADLQRQEDARNALGQKSEEDAKADWVKTTADTLENALGSSVPREVYERAAEAVYIIEGGADERREAVDEVMAGKSRIPFVQALYVDPNRGSIHTHTGPLRQDPNILTRALLGRMKVPKSQIVILATSRTDTITNGRLTGWVRNYLDRQTRANRNPRARTNLPIEDFEVKPTDESEEQIRRIRLSLFQKFLNEGYSKNKAIRVMGRIYHPGERLDPHDAKTLAFQMAGRRRGSRFMYEGTNKPTSLSKHRARQKRSDESAFQKRKDYENMLAVGRKSGPYRVTHEPSYKTGKPVFYIWPLGREYRTESGVKRAWERLK